MIILKYEKEIHIQRNNIQTISDNIKIMGSVPYAEKNRIT